MGRRVRKGLIWEAPKEMPQSGPKADHAKIASQLKANPGAWARVHKYASPRSASTMAYVIKQGRMKSYLPVGAYETASRRINGECWLFMRYVGEAQEHAGN